MAAPSSPPAGQAPAAAQNAGELASPPFEVLASFQMERTGQSVRIVDADGSVYEGNVISVEGEKNANRGAVVASAVAPASSSAIVQIGSARGVVMAPAPAHAGERMVRSGASSHGAEVSAWGAPASAAAVALPAQAPGLESGLVFNVSGTNRNLNEYVIFTGYLSGAGVQDAKASWRRVSQNQSPTAGGSLPDNRPPAQNWRVTGEVSISRTNQFHLEAVPVRP
jgi:hypothetical protein